MIDYSVYDMLPCPAAVIDFTADPKVIYCNDYYRTFFAGADPLHNSDFAEGVWRVTREKHAEFSWDGHCTAFRCKQIGENVFVVIFEDMTQKKEEEEKQRELNMIDPLSRLYKKEYAIDKIKSILASAGEQDKCALVVLDIDNFKRINDTYGHDSGDEVIATAAASIKGIMGSRAITGRFGGDEFFAFFNNVNVIELKKRLGALMAAIKKEQPGVEAYRDITCSAGVATGLGRVTYRQLFKQADSALYKVKRNGKGDYMFFDGEYIDGGELCYSDIEPEDNGTSPNQQSLINVALEIAAQSTDNDNAVANILRHLGALFELDEIQIMKYDMVKDSVTIEYTWAKEHDGKRNTVSFDKRIGYYEHGDLELFYIRLKNEGVFIYTPDFKQYFSPKYAAVLKKWEFMSHVYSASIDSDETFFATWFKTRDTERVWTREELEELESMAHLLSMFMKSSQIVSEHEKQLEYKLSFSKYGLYQSGPFYEEAGRVGREAQRHGQLLAMIHFDVKELYKINCNYSWDDGSKILDSFEKLLSNERSGRSISCRLQDTDQFYTLFRYSPDKKDIIVGKIAVTVKEFAQNFAEYDNPPVIIKAGVCFFEKGQLISRAIETARNVKRGYDFSKSGCVVAEKIDDFRGGGEVIYA